MKVVAIVILSVLLTLFGLVRLAFGVVPPYTSLSFAWAKAPSHGTNITYVLRWGSAPGATNFEVSVGTNLTAVVTNPTSGFLYFHAVARTPDGLESLPSNVVVETNYPASPIQLRITTNTTTSLKLEGTVNGVGWVHLATVTNDPVLLEMRRAQMLRAVRFPPLP